MSFRETGRLIYGESQGRGHDEIVHVRVTPKIWDSVNITTTTNSLRERKICYGMADRLCECLGIILSSRPGSSVIHVSQVKEVCKSQWTFSIRLLHVLTLTISIMLVLFTIFGLVILQF